MAQRSTLCSTPPFTPGQLEVRRPVWDTLGNLYLDIDSRPDLPRMAHVLADLGLNEAELNTIWLKEVTPALIDNLSVPISVWAYFDLDWLEERIIRRQRSIRQFRDGPKFTRWLRHIWDVKIWPNGMHRYFQLVMGLRGELLALPESQRSDRTTAWSWLAHAYFWPDSSWRPERPHNADLLAVFAALESYLRPLLMASDSKKMPLEQRRAHILKLIREEG